MSSKHEEFLIEGFEVEERDRLTVFGRNGDALIRLNDTFDIMFRYKRRRYPDELGDEPVREVERPVQLRVVAIEAYELDLNALGQGMTGSLVLEGEGLRSLAPGWLLAKRNGSSLESAPVSNSVLA